MESRPTTEQIKRRALDMIEETMAYPKEAGERLLGIKRAAVETLIAKSDAALMEKYYSGWTVEDLRALLGFLPATHHKKDDWHL